MTTSRRYGMNRSGFTLIEMAVVLVIVGIVISVMAGVLPSLIGSSKIRQAQATMERVDLALQGYLAANGRLPCPDTDGSGLENRTEGASPPSDDSCDAYVGRLPYATLGLSSALDPWQEPIRYGVYEDMVRTRHDTLCAALPCVLCLSDFINNPTTEFVRTSDGSHTSNQAYVIVSGGPKNLSGSGGFFDGRNAAGDPVFETPNRTMDAAYDDLVRAVSFTYLMGKLCRGNLGGNDPWAGCLDEFGVVDCDRPQCASHPDCLGGETFRITTAAIPQGPVGGTYMTDLSAAGGSSPYAWQLSSAGGFADFDINPYTGQLTGTLNQCPGTYNVGAYVQDSSSPDDDGPQSDTRSYPLEVLPDLNVTCTSTPGSAITWVSPSQQELFRADGGRLGTVTWTLNAGGANGFAVYTTGEDACVLRKTGTTAPGVYAFSLTAMDGTCSTNTATLAFQVTVTAEGGATPGAISGVIDTLRFSLYQSYTPDIVHMSGNDYAIAAQGFLNQGYLHAVDITPDGQIGTRDHYTTFEPANTATPDILRVAEDVFVVAYVAGNRGVVKTVRIANGGQSMTVLRTLNLNNNWSHPVIKQVGSNMFAAAFNGPGDNVVVTTLEISPDGQSISQHDSVSFSNSRGTVDLVHVTANIFAVVHHANQGGYVSTVTIDADGRIGDTLLDSLRFEQGACLHPQIVQTAAGIFAVVYQGPNDQGVVKTIAIADDGAISDMALDTLVFETQRAIAPAVVNAGGGVFAIAYTGPSNQGGFKTILIDPTGEIGNAVLDSLIFETNSCLEPAIIALGSKTFAVVYRGPDNNRGVIKTIGLQ